MPEIKGLRARFANTSMNGFAALDVRPQSCYVIIKATSDKTAVVSCYFALSCSAFGVYTEFGGEPENTLVSLADYSNLIRMMEQRHKGGES
ncbi:MAG: hypothetical protein RR893_07620 [Clostridia bacterium]